MIDVPVERLPRRFREKFIVDAHLTGNMLTPCWLWISNTNGDGYGIYKVDNKNEFAHRYAYEVLIDFIPSNLEIDHLCRVRNCVNPEHLDPVPHMINIRRGEAGKYNKIKTHCKRGHEFTKENTRISDIGSRVCKTCQRWRRKEWEAKQKIC